MSKISAVQRPVHFLAATHKRFLVTLILATCMITSLSIFATSVNTSSFQVGNCSNGAVPIYQMNKPNVNHFYTTNYNEAVLYQQNGYTFEKYAGWIFPNSQGATTQPLYRMYNPSTTDYKFAKTASELNQLQLAGWQFQETTGYSFIGATTGTAKFIQMSKASIGDHIYSTNSIDINNAAQAGYAMEADVGYIFTTCPNANPFSTTPVYRFWSPVFKSHFFTVSENEKAKLATDRNWVFENVAFDSPNYYPNQPVSPVYRYWSPRFQKHFFTISTQERNILASDRNWVPEGVGFYGYVQSDVYLKPVYRYFSPAFSNAHFFTTNEAERTILSNDRNWIYENVGWYTNDRAY